MMVQVELLIYTTHGELDNIIISDELYYSMMNEYISIRIMKMVVEIGEGGNNVCVCCVVKSVECV